MALRTVAGTAISNASTAKNAIMTKTKVILVILVFCAPLIRSVPVRETDPLTGATQRKPFVKVNGRWG